MEPDKHSKIQWFSLSHLPIPLIPNSLYGMQCYEKNIPYQEFGWKKVPKFLEPFQAY